MQIREYSCKKTDLTFGATRIMRTKIIDKENERLVDAFITSFDRKDPKDYKILKNIKDEWKQKGSEYMNSLIDSGEEILGLELAGKETNPIKKFLGFVSIGKDSFNIFPNFIEAKYMEASPEAKASVFSKEVYNSDRKYSGVGTELLAAVARLAKERKQEGIVLFSANDTFYDHIKMTMERYGHRFFSGKKLDDFIKQTEAKYKLEPDKIFISR
ncbi:MAG TPA: hypothetical protein P5556_08710 [Candidatus Gastranaerophilales bacterium]|nr:hypothetical protein [Candidatus Gastranaerophilales bacterium]